LADASALKRTSFSTFNISWEQGGPMVLTSVHPPDEAMESLLMRLRPFFLQGEPIYLFSIYDMCARHLRSAELNGYLAEARAQWKRYVRRGGGFGLRVDEQDIDPERAVELVLYGSGQFHYEARDEWRALGPMGQMFTREKFNGWVTAATGRVLHAAAVIRAGLAADLIDG
jgi:hypothetical protein